MKEIKDLNMYMRNNFQNLLVEKPLFYNSKIGIRFEIGDPKIDYFQEKKRYLNGVYLRSIVLFEEIFKPETDIIIVIDAHRFSMYNEDPNDVKKVLLNYISNKDLHNKITFCKSSYIEDDEQFDKFTYLLQCKVKDINYRDLLKAIGNQDMGVNPSFEDYVFFININDNIVYNLYDDRGLDLVSSEISSLELIYLKYGDWILDYDRKRIDKTFSKSY